MYERAICSWGCLICIDKIPVERGSTGGGVGDLGGLSVKIVV